jgi:hypothetical protein
MYRGNKSLVDEITTLRHHLEASHAVHDFCKFSSISEFSSVQGKYCNWAKGANFVSKLPGDIKKQKAAVEEATRTLDCDLREKKLSERVIPYSDKLFHRAAIEWLMATDQVRNSFLQLILRFHCLSS